MQLDSLPRFLFKKRHSTSIIQAKYMQKPIKISRFAPFCPTPCLWATGVVPVVVPGVVSVAAGVGLQHIARPVKVKGSEGLILKMITYSPKQTRRTRNKHGNNKKKNNRKNSMKSKGQNKAKIKRTTRNNEEQEQEGKQRNKRKNKEEGQEETPRRRTRRKQQGE